MPSVAEFISSLARKAGIPESDQALQTTLQAVGDAQVDDTVYARVTNSLMSEEAARNNPKIKAHFVASALDGVDATLNNVIGQYELTDEEKQTFQGKNTWGRVEYVSNLIKAKESAKASAVGGEKKALVEEIAKLQDILKQEKIAAQKREEELKNQFTSQISDLHYDGMLSGFEWATEFPSEVNKLTLKQLVQSRLKEKGAVMVFKDGQFQLKNAISPDLDWMDGGNTVTAKDFITKVAADSKMLKVSDPNPTPKPKPGSPAPAPAPAPAPQPNGYDNSVFERMKQNLKGDALPA